MKKRISSMGVLRALACTAVFTSHCYISVMGAWGVSVFIMLSGFLLSYNGLDRAEQFPSTAKGCAGYAYRKIKKLYPLYFFSLVMTIALLLFLAGGAMPMAELVRKGQELLLCAALLQAWVPVKGWPFAINAVGWYLSATVVLYFVFPVILRRIKKIGGIKNALTAVVLIYLGMIALAAAASELYSAAFRPDEAQAENFQHWFSYIFPIYRIGDFSIGCLLGYVFLKAGEVNWTGAGSCLFEAAAFLLAAAAQYVHKNQLLPTYLIYNALFIPSTAMLIYSFAMGKGVISKILDFPPTRFISDYSGEIFLLHCVAYKIASPISGYVPGPYALQRTAFIVLNLGAAFAAAVIWRRLGRRFPVLSLK